MMRVFALLPMSLLGGCITLLPEPAPAPRLFALETAQVARSADAPIDAVIAVAPPGGERLLLGSDLIWRTGDQMAFIAQSQWASRGEEALQAMLVETLAGEGRFRAAVRAGEANSDYTLRWDVRAFEIDENTMQARFAADVVVLARARAIVAATRVESAAPVADRASSAAADALARAARDGSARVARFAAEAVSTSDQSGVDQ